ncbi:integrator complex subunit 10-like isoform X2 [Homarus americanus]|uniref:integrator complex subunit 10-like isoform X2 n=1 Tax=Homarus americanus TaxID=6706 RepID=UPI001C47A82B|nr:integrator complex subunit 10-like isoform X2 [Homarus americanus]
MATPSLSPDEELSHLTDEEYLIYRAKEQQKKDPCAAKCWMITAQALFPKNFGIQFEVYQIEKAAKNVKEAAKCLSVLLRDFAPEPLLWREVETIMSALRQNNPDSQISFLSYLFNMLPKDIQLGMVLSAAERSQDTMTRCRLMLLLTTTFPETTAHHGLQLVDSLLAAEKHCPGALNPFRRMLVCDLLPRLLQTHGLEVRPKTLYSLLSRAIEFYVAYVTTSPKVMQGVLDGDGKIDDPWQQLFTVVQLIGWNLGWDLASGFQSTSNREVILQRIQSLVEGGARLGGPKGEGGEDVREVLYTTLTVFLHALMDYTKRLYPDFNQENSASTSTPLTLVEAFVFPECEREESVIVPPKRSRPSLDEDPTIPIITVSRPTPAGQAVTPVVGLSVNTPGGIAAGGLSQALTTAIKCWDLLNSYEQLRAEFVRLLESLGTDRWWWLRVFTVDVLIYQGRLAEASRELRHTLTQRVHQLPTTFISTNLKLASVLYALNNLSGAAEAVLEVVGQLPGWVGVGSLAGDLCVSAAPNRRHLHVLALTRPQCLQFATTLLIHALRQRIIVDRHMDDLCIGHLITLLQYEWPKYMNTFEEILQIIRKQGGFSYPLFYSYIITPDILEEFMFLATKEGGNLQMDIIPINHSNKQQRTISTRGVDRDLKHDFKMGMKKLMLRSSEPIEGTIITFLTREGSLVHENLM